MKAKKLIVVVCKDMTEAEMSALDSILHKVIAATEADVDGLIVTDADVKVISGSDAKRMFIIPSEAPKTPEADRLRKDITKQEPEKIIEDLGKE